MKRIIVALTVVFSSLCVAFGQDSALLYKIEGNGASQPSYLYGTFHLVCPNDLRLTDAMRKALGDSRQLYLEIDFDDPALQAKMMTGMMLGQGKNLSQQLTPEDYSVLNKFLQENVGMGLQIVGNLKPIAITSMIAVGLLKCEPASYDLTFAKLAGEQGKEVLGLETFEAQMAVLDSIPLEQQVKDLVGIARSPNEAREELASLMAAYREHDLPQMMKLINESKFGDSSEFSEELLDKRNRNWIPVIEKAVREKPSFIAFGAGHLGGPAGVVNLLREKGFTVTPIR